MQVDKAKRYDLVILAYQVWFLSPSRPITSFLASPEAAQLLNDTPVVTLIGCRNMWLMAQEKLKARLDALGARLVDNIVLTDECGSAASFLATPLWMFTGRQKAFPWVPKAGISEAEIAGARRFGVAIGERLALSGPVEQPMLRGLGAVRIDEKLIASERVGTRSFKAWGTLLAALGPRPAAQPSPSRRADRLYRFSVEPDHHRGAGHRLAEKAARPADPRPDPARKGLLCCAVRRVRERFED